MQINKNLKAGFTLVEIMIVVAIIGLLAAIAIPNFVRARTTAQTNACINNLRQIDGAVQQYVLENRIAAGGSVTLDNVKDYLKGSIIPICPGGGTYSVNAANVNPACSLAESGHVLPTTGQATGGTGTGG